MKTAVVKRHDIANAPVMRIDASFQLSEGVSVRRIIADCPYPVVKCGDVMERIWHAGRWKRVYVNNPKTGIPLVGSSAMLKSDLSDIKLISRKYTEDMADKMLHPRLDSCVMFRHDWQHGVHEHRTCWEACFPACPSA